MTQILNIAGYKFITLTELSVLRTRLLDEASRLDLKGTILLSREGINISLAGMPQFVTEFMTWLDSDTRFSGMSYRQSYSDYRPFKHMRVKLKKEIITLKQPDIQPEKAIAPEISPAELKQWLDENRDITLLDTRNDYEVRFGTFKNAVNLHIDDFSHFPEAMKQVSDEKPIIMFCTGGIRCEKAAWVMLNAGYKNIFQLKGGILNYFAAVGGDHYQDECFVFDQRVSLNNCLDESGTMQCKTCQGPIKKDDMAVCSSCNL